MFATMVAAQKDATIMPVEKKLISIPFEPVRPSCGMCARNMLPVCGSRYNKATKLVEYKTFNNACMLGMANCENPGNGKPFPST